MQAKTRTANLIRWLASLSMFRMQAPYGGDSRQFYGPSEKGLLLPFGSLCLGQVTPVVGSGDPVWVNWLARGAAVRV
jgi:hypothetical protein